MKNKKIVLILIDSYPREQVAAERLRAALLDKGLNVEFCDRRLLEYAATRINPDAIILPKLHKVPQIEPDILSNTKVYLMMAESFTGATAGMKTYYTTLASKWWLERLDGIFCWGQVDFDETRLHIINKGTRLHLTGHPITQAWLNQPVMAPDGSRDAAKKPKTIGITSSLRFFTHEQRPDRFIDAVVSLEDASSSGFFDPPNHCEGWIAYEACFIRVLHNIFTINTDIQFKIRVHPNETVDEYRAFEKRFSNVSVSKGGAFKDWLSGVDIMLSSYSTSMLDAAVYGRPVYSLSGLFPDFVRNLIPSGIAGMEFVKHFPELKEMDLSCLAQSDSVRNDAEVAKFLKSVFNIPSQESASEQISSIISADLDSKQANTARRIIPIEKICSLYMDLRSGFADNVYYKPHRFLRNRKLKKEAQSLRCH